jgi:hypothetical protein
MRRSVSVFLLVPVVLACAPGGDAATPAVAATIAQTQTLDHDAPNRDSVGPMPKRFSWTKVEGADTYGMAVYNDADTLIWKGNDLRETFIDWPDEAKLEPGTYFWIVAAYKGDRIIADSGRSAFVVTESR